ncbi:MAG: hypothetical protein R3C56_36240 [Pirellulaceae bacterium]
MRSLKNLDQPIAAMAADANASEDNKLAALRARELGSSQYETLAKLATTQRASIGSHSRPVRI